MTGTQDDLGDRITTVGLLFEASSGLRRIFEQRLSAPGGVSNQALDVLIRLVRTPGERLRMSDLTAQTALTPSGLTRAVDRLDRAGLVVRESCPEDRRGAFAVLTPEGRRVMDRLLPVHAHHIDEVFEGLMSPHEERTLVDLLRRLRDHVHADPTCTSACEGDQCKPSAAARTDVWSRSSTTDG